MIRSGGSAGYSRGLYGATPALTLKGYQRSLDLEPTPACLSEQSPPTGASRDEAIQAPDDRQNWQSLGNCLGTDPNLFFPERGESTREAKEACRGCKVRAECLEYALAKREILGIWGWT